MNAIAKPSVIEEARDYLRGEVDRNPHGLVRRLLREVDAVACRQPPATWPEIDDDQAARILQFLDAERMRRGFSRASFVGSGAALRLALTQVLGTHVPTTTPKGASHG